MFKIELFTEYCCDECGNIIHNHFDCPICKKEYAGTNIYDEFDIKYDTEIHCNECNTIFEVIAEESYLNLVIKVKE